MTGTRTMSVVLHRDVEMIMITLNRGSRAIDDVQENGGTRAFVIEGTRLRITQLRKLLGETAFWAGIRRYTTEHFGESVTTDDFARLLRSMDLSLE